MRADEMVAKHGQDLIGQKILTWAVGEYPGGWAQVYALNTDPGAPEIPLNVMHPTFGKIGVFENEQVFFHNGEFQESKEHNRHGYGPSPFEWL